MKEIIASLLKLKNSMNSRVFLKANYSHLIKLTLIFLNVKMIIKILKVKFPLWIYKSLKFPIIKLKLKNFKNKMMNSKHKIKHSIHCLLKFRIYPVWLKKLKPLIINWEIKSMKTVNWDLNVIPLNLLLNFKLILWRMKKLMLIDKLNPSKMILNKWVINKGSHNKV